VAGPSETDLDLVGNDQDAMRPAELAERLQVSLRRYDDAGLGLNRLRITAATLSGPSFRIVASRAPASPNGTCTMSDTSGRNGSW
jgi:hypothetical protein